MEMVVAGWYGRVWWLVGGEVVVGREEVVVGGW